MRNKPHRYMGALCSLVAGTVSAFTLILTASKGFAQGAPSIQRIGSITLSALRYDITPGADGRLHFVMSGNPVLIAEVRTLTGTTDRYEIRASRSIDYTLTAGNSAIANAVADGAVHIEVHSPLRPQAGGGERVLVVTGDRAIFNNQPQGAATADVIGNPYLTLYDPQLASPAVLSNAVSIHVNFLTRQFQVLGDANHRPTMIVEPKAAPPPAPPAAPAAGSGRMRFLPRRPLQAAAIPASLSLGFVPGSSEGNR